MDADGDDCLVRGGEGAKVAIFLLFGGKLRWTEEEYPNPAQVGRGGGGEAEYPPTQHRCVL